MNETTREADVALWANFREWMAAHDSPLLIWTLHEHHNNHNGLLQVFLSRNQARSLRWPNSRLHLLLARRASTFTSAAK